MLTKNVVVMLLIVLAETALRWNFAFWSYFVVIFRVGVEVLYRRAIRTSGILPVKYFSQPRVLQTKLTSISLINYCYNIFCIFCKMGKRSDLSAEKKLFAFFRKQLTKLANLLMHSQCALSEPISSSMKTRKLTVCRFI